MLKPKQLLPSFLPGLVLLLMITFTGCSSLPGDGGTSTISGKVFVERYNESGILYQQYYGPDEDVFIIYGDNTGFDDATKTSYDGSFKFTFLRKGTYTLFTYSDCLTCDGSKEVVIQTIEITDNNQNITTEDFVIENH